MKTSILRIAGLILPVLFFAASASAQSPDASSLTLDVFAGDGQGHAIRGLTQQDFTVTDNGQPAQITGFRAVDSATNPNAVSVLLVVDMINDASQALQREREQIEEFLNQNGGQLAYPVSIASISETGVKAMPGYSKDGHVLLTAFQSLKTEMRPVGRSAGFYGAAEWMQVSIQAVAQVVQFVSRQPGHKLIVFISPGWPMLPAASFEASDRQRAWIFDNLVGITNQLRESRISFYSVNPFLLGNGDPFFYRAYLKPVKNIDRAEYPYLAMQVLAEHSGGLALTPGNDIVGGINTAIRDAGIYYELTFTAQTADRNNELHELKVQTARPGVKVRTTAFYYARPTASMKGKTTPPEKIAEPSTGLPKQ